MQLKINQRLNQILTIMVVSNILVGWLLWSKTTLDDNFIIFFLVLAVYNTVLFFVFKMLEVNWDKRIMQKMAINKQIAIANINKAEIMTTIRDSGGRKYNIWRFDITYWDQDMKSYNCSIADKLSIAVENVPIGTVYITNDEKKPLNKFILQNIIIGNIHSLKPIVAKYESNKEIKIKYLNVYYNNGLIIETFKQSISSTKQAESPELS